ncbi:TPA: phage portal protein [Streptococcus equi subsp. zooepidemicus]|nr:phage portal protein [Streptococcus equi subsp. zooepidemicus]
MGILDFFSFKKSGTLSDDDSGSTTSEKLINVVLKEDALYKCVNYLARIISKSTFKLKTTGDLTDNQKDWVYWINTKPNPNQSASQFWVEVVQKLLIDGAALIFVIPGKGIYVADAFTQDKRLTGNKFKITRVQEQPYEKEFNYDQVIYLKNDNSDLMSKVNSLWEEYGELLGRVIDNQKIANQIRFTMTPPKDKVRERAQENSDGGRQPKSDKDFFKRTVEKIRTESVVGIPVTANTKYEEYGSKNTGSVKSYVDDIKKLKDQYMAEFAEMLGIPISLLHGDIADNQKNYELLLEGPIESLITNIVDGLEYAIFDKSETLQGCFIKVTGLKNYDLFSVSNQADKLISSGFVYIDEVREAVGLPELPDGLGKVLYMTKNYESVLGRGGEVDEEAES